MRSTFEILLYFSNVVEEQEFYFRHVGNAFTLTAMPVLILLIACAFLCSCHENGTNSSQTIRDSIPIKMKIPEDAFHVPGIDGGTYVYVKSLNAHYNNAYLVFFHSTTGAALDSGRFFAVCPSDDPIFIKHPREQFVRFERDTLWYRGENGNVECWMQKEK